jgi:pimeloyl-ACP methyl ester carboxylesterase
MAQPVAVVFVHGINTLVPGYHEPMENAIKAALPKRLRDQVTFRSVFWAGRVRERQQQYLDAVAKDGLFADTVHRRLVIQGLGDAAAYQKTRSFRNSAYYQIQADVRAVLEDLDKDNLPNRPLIFVGHSLGCHIISTFAWDLNTIKHWNEGRIAKEDEEVAKFANYLKDGSAFRRLDTLAGLVMMGSNMPLFTFTFGPDRVFPITRSRGDGDAPAFPGKGLDANTLSRARWVNYYSRNDLLGYPLKPLNEAYANEPLLSDIEVASEGILRRLASYVFAPIAAYRAHIGYWTHRKVVRGAARLIESIATADEPPPVSRFSFSKRAPGA